MLHEKTASADPAHASRPSNTNLSVLTEMLAWHSRTLSAAHSRVSWAPFAGHYRCDQIAIWAQAHLSVS